MTLPGDPTPQINLFAELTIGASVLVIILGLGLLWRMRRRWRQYQLNKRLESGDMFADEMREHNLAIGPEPEPLVTRKLILGMLLEIGGVFTLGWLGLWLEPPWVFVVIALLFLYSLGIYFWRRANRPPDREEGPDADADADRSETVVPPEAVAGFAAAVCAVGLFALVVSFM